MTILLHSDRYSITSTVRKGGVVVHDSESGDGSSASLVAALTSPGNFPSDSRPGGFYGAGYHGVTDGLGGYVRMADGTAAPYSAPPLNATWWHICMPGRANQTREEWLDELSRNHIRGVAHFIHDMWIEDGKTWQPWFVFSDLLVKGVLGYTSHYQVSLAWHKTTHTDPGKNFPWDVLESDVYALVKASEEDDMATARLVRFNGYINVFLIGGGGPAMAVGGADYDHLVKAGVPKVFVDHEQEFLSACRQAELDPANPQELIPGGPSDHF